MGYRDGYYAITTGKKLTVVRPNQIAHQPVLGTYVTPQDLPEDVEVFYGVLCGLSYDYNNDSLKASVVQFPILVILVFFLLSAKM